MVEKANAALNGMNSIARADRDSTGHPERLAYGITNPDHRSPAQATGKPAQLRCIPCKGRLYARESPYFFMASCEAIFFR
jgi:hypothetical protein